MKRQALPLLLVTALVASLFPVSAFAQDTASTVENEIVEEESLICEHSDAEVFYESVGDWLHTATELCGCGEETAFWEESCWDDEEDGYCDGCEAERPCLHENIEQIYEHAEDWSHTVTELCECGEETDFWEEECLDADGDQICDLCEGELSCLHEETELVYEQGRQEFNHVAVLTCICGEELEYLMESCTDEDGDCFCDGCDAELEMPITCGDVNFDGVIDEADAQYVLSYVVGSVEDIDETMADTNGDGVINAKDATCILRFANGLIDVFPVEA